MYANPTRMPFLFNYNCSDFLFGCDLLQYECDSDAYNADCRVLERVVSLEVGDADNNQSTSYLALTSRDGGLALFDINEEKTAFFLESAGQLKILQSARLSREQSYIALGSMKDLYLMPVTFGRPFDVFPCSCGWM